MGQRFGFAPFDAHAPQMAAVDVERIDVMLIGGKDDGSLIGTQRYIFGFKFSGESAAWRGPPVVATE